MSSIAVLFTPYYQDQFRQEDHHRPIPTPHINAKKEDIAKTVLMPGDPLRARFIAETFQIGRAHV